MAYNPQKIPETFERLPGIKAMHSLRQNAAHLFFVFRRKVFINPVVTTHVVRLFRL